MVGVQQVQAFLAVRAEPDVANQTTPAEWRTYGAARILRRRADPGQVTGSGIASPRCCLTAGGRCRKSVGTAAYALPLAGPSGPTGTTGLDVSAGHGRVGTKRLDLDETPVSYGSEGWGVKSVRVPRDPRGDRIARLWKDACDRTALARRSWFMFQQSRLRTATMAH